MDNSLNALCDGIKKVLARLKPQNNALSFIVLIGKNNQGKSTLLKQANLESISVLSEHESKIYFNHQGIIIELGDKWFSQSKMLLQNTLKKLNRCNFYLKITGLVFCLDVNELLVPDRNDFLEQKKIHLQLLERWGINLGYTVELAVIINKMDTLAGFNEFYQSNHFSELLKPLGFSIDCFNDLNKKMEVFASQFDHLIESIDQQVIHKMHLTRSTLRRNLIREFPLQFSSLRAPLHALLQGISPKLFNLHALYFASAEQNGASIDRINKKFQHEYALVVQDIFPQATNYRAFFVEGAFKTIQQHCSQAPQVLNFSHKPLIALTAGVATLALSALFYNHYTTIHTLDAASKELLAFDVLNNQKNLDKQALYHLSSAANKLSSISSNRLSLPAIHQLKTNIKMNTHQRIQHQFLPSILKEIEEVIMNAGNTPIIRYEALKIYLMFSQSEHFSSPAIQTWFALKWKAYEPQLLKDQMALLKNTIAKAPNKITINTQIVNDARNYLNALPSSYLFYSIAKEFFSKETQSIHITGFQLPSTELPIYYTRAGYNLTIKQIPQISHLLHQENWVLQRQDSQDLSAMIEEAYSFDYATWWQAFMRKTKPSHYQSYQEAREVLQKLEQNQNINQLVQLFQQETKADLNEKNSMFNESVASKFTDLNLVSNSSIHELSLKIQDLAHFDTTLSIINDGGKTAFNVTKSRFLSEFGTDSVSQLYNHARQLPEPLSNWAKQIASETWSLLLKDSRQYINEQWSQTVYREFSNSIAMRYPFDSTQSQEIAINDFNHFFSTNGTLNTFTEHFIKPFLDISNAEWKSKAVNDSILPIDQDTLDNLVRANIITNMFFPDLANESHIDFSLQKINLDPIVSSLVLEIGATSLNDNQNSDSLTRFNWPQSNAKLSLNSIEGNHYELAEQGNWALFKLLEKVNVLVDEQDSSSLQILFEINSNSGRYLLKTNNQINPFTPGILNGFVLNKTIV